MTLLNTRAEWHAFGIGGLFGALIVLGRPEIAGALIAVIIGAESVGRRRDPDTPTRTVSGHLRDARRELAYVAAGAVAGGLLTVAVTILTIPIGP